MNTNSYKPMPDIESEYPAGDIPASPAVWSSAHVHNRRCSSNTVWCTTARMSVILICFNLISWPFHIPYCIELYVILLLLIILYLWTNAKASETFGRKYRHFDSRISEGDWMPECVIFSVFGIKNIWNWLYNGYFWPKHVVTVHTSE